MDLSPLHFHLLREMSLAQGGSLHFLILADRAQYESALEVPGCGVLPFCPTLRVLPSTLTRTALPLAGAFAMANYFLPKVVWRRRSPSAASLPSDNLPDAPTRSSYS